MVSLRYNIVVVDDTDSCKALGSAMENNEERKLNEYTEFIIALVNLLKVDTYVETELKWNGPLNHVRQHVRRAIGIDPHFRSTVRHNEEIFGMSIKAYVDTLNERRAGEFIDLLFLDAGRTLEDSMTELMLLSPYVKTCKGLILVHNTHPIAKELTINPCCGEVWKIARTLHESATYSQYYEIVTLPGPCTGLSIIRKAPYHLTWDKASVTNNRLGAVTTGKVRSKARLMQVY